MKYLYPPEENEICLLLSFLRDEHRSLASGLVHVLYGLGLGIVVPFIFQEDLVRVRTSVLYITLIFIYTCLHMYEETRHMYHTRLSSVAHVPPMLRHCTFPLDLFTVKKIQAIVFKQSCSFGGPGLER